MRLTKRSRPSETRSNTVKSSGKSPYRFTGRIVSHFASGGGCREEFVERGSGCCNCATHWLIEELLFAECGRWVSLSSDFRETNNVYAIYK